MSENITRRTSKRYPQLASEITTCYKKLKEQAGSTYANVRPWCGDRVANFVETERLPPMREECEAIVAGGRALTQECEERGTDGFFVGDHDDYDYNDVYDVYV